MLVDNQIKNAVVSGDIVINPFVERQINPNSYDVTLGCEFYSYCSSEFGHVPVIDPRSNREYGYKRIENQVILYPNEFILGTTREYFTLCNGYAAVLEGKSSFARLGLAVHITGGFIDTGFAGNITLEIKNENDRCAIILREGDLIGQLVFFKITKATVPYDMKPDSKYKNQEGVTPSKYYRNDWYD